MVLVLLGLALAYSTKLDLSARSDEPEVTTTDTTDLTTDPVDVVTLLDEMATESGERSFRRAFIGFSLVFHLLGVQGTVQPGFPQFSRACISTGSS